MGTLQYYSHRFNVQTGEQRSLLELGLLAVLSQFDIESIMLCGVQ